MRDDYRVRLPSTLDLPPSPPLPFSLSLSPVHTAETPGRSHRADRARVTGVGLASAEESGESPAVSTEGESNSSLTAEAVRAKDDDPSPDPPPLELTH